MNNNFDILQKALQSIRSVTDFVPHTGLVLGSGLGEFAKNRIKIETAIPFCNIEGLPVSTAPGHHAELIFGYIGNEKVVAASGRIHYYEGYTMQQVVMPVRLMHLLGAENLILTNASGGINKDFNAGDLMIIRDHISSFTVSPLIGPNEEKLGARFPDMTEVYNNELSEKLVLTAEKLGMEIKQGVYLQTTGPNYETPAEIKMYSMLGADAVGMSTAVEAIAANHCGMKVCGISLISNKASGLGTTKLSHSEVLEAGKTAAVKFENLVSKFTEQLYENK